VRKHPHNVKCEEHDTSRVNKKHTKCLLLHVESQRQPTAPCGKTLKSEIWHIDSRGDTKLS